MAETITFSYTESGEDITVTLNENARGPAGPAPSGTGLVSVTAGVLDSVTTLSARVAADASNLRTQLGLGTLATQSGTFSGTSSGTNTGDQDLSGYAPLVSPSFTTPSLGVATADSVNGIAILAGTGTLQLGDGYIDLRYGGSLNMAEGGAINTSNFGGAINTNALGGAINTSDYGGAINTSNYGGAINTTAGGSFTTGAGNLTGPATTGTLALTSDIPTDYEITSAQGRRLIASLKVAAAPSTGRAYFASTKSGSITFTVLTSTGYAKLINSVGTYGSTTPTAGSGAPGTPISFTVTATGSHRAFGVSATDSAGVHSGNLTYIDVSTLQLTAIDVASATALTQLVVSDNQLTELNVSANTALTALSCLGNQLTALDVDANNALLYLMAENNLLPTAVVDQILVDLDELNVNGDRVDLGGTGNGAASATGIAAGNGLVADGWATVAYN